MPTSAGSRLGPPSFITDSFRHRRALGEWAREAHQGHLENVGSVTLGTGTAATSVTDFRVGPNSWIGFMPTTANAAAELAAGTMYVSSRSINTFVVTHANTSTADRTFVYSLLG